MAAICTLTLPLAIKTSSVTTGIAAAIVESVALPKRIIDLIPHCSSSHALFGALTSVDSQACQAGSQRLSSADTASCRSG
jgi:hypothetical protein